MTNEDFDVAALAAYLHLQPAQVARLADRGRLPGRKVGGKWRFSRAEIHHWLEDRIGLSDRDELLEVESVLDRAPSPVGPETVRIVDMLPAEAISVPLPARTRQSVIRAMVQCVARTGLLWDQEKMFEAVLAREELHPTALDNGVALLHPRRPLASILAEPVLGLGRTYQGIPFGGSHGCLTDVFFLICSVDDRGHLRVLARLSRLIAMPDFLPELRQLEDAGQIRQFIGQQERQLDD